GSPRGSRTRRSARRQPALRGEDVEGETEITLDEAFLGTSRTVELNGPQGARRVEIRIPAGIQDGARVRAAGQGSPGSGGGASGDIFVRVRIRPHPRFTRVGNDLQTKVPVPLATAIAGGSVAVQTLRGTTVQLTIPSSTQNTARLRLRGMGMPRVRGDGAGDLIAEVDVRVPVPVPDQLRAWAEAAGGDA
ncbi:MAG: J domain-containing protein, partial [Candidatus Dormibacteraeota bacterium]|nr:J domain-containing protein [Candidatus Dormibacteraeota bacterium]